MWLVRVSYGVQQDKCLGNQSQFVLSVFNFFRSKIKEKKTKLGCEWNCWFPRSFEIFSWFEWAIASENKPELSIGGCSACICFMLVSRFVYFLTLRLEATYSSETSADFQQLARRNIPKDRNSSIILLLYEKHIRNFLLQSCTSRVHKLIRY